jgi:hypothetical protein
VVDESGALVMNVPHCNASRVAEARALTLSLKDDDLPADYDGWLEYAAYNDAAGFDSFLGKFSVPDAPVETPDVLYLFTGACSTALHRYTASLCSLRCVVGATE